MNVHSPHYDPTDDRTWTRDDFLINSEPQDCTWHAGCDNEGDPELGGLCDFHFDACEREENVA